jgi:hypothetical protein
MIRNLRLLRRGLEADVSMGVDKWGANTWVHVEMPIKEVQKILDQLDKRMTAAAQSWVSGNVANASMTVEINQRVEVAVAAEKRRLDRRLEEVRERAKREVDSVEVQRENLRLQLSAANSRLAEIRAATNHSEH